MCRCVIVLLTLGLLVRCDDVLTKSDEREGRLLKEHVDDDRWKAIQPSEQNKWVESDVPTLVDESPEIIPTKRRRLRKRKRRPLIFNEDDGQYHPRPRRRRPVRLDELNDTWDEMEAESPKRPNKRRRITPVYQPVDNSESVSATISFGHEQDQLPKFREEAQREINGQSMPNKIIPPSTTIRSTTVQNIKELIKLNSGLSLSEVLQQRNLSLTDLLRGKKQAISALTNNKTDNRNEPANINKNIGNKSTTDDQKIKRVENHFSNKMNNNVKKVEVVIESITEKRIFVPSHPKLYTSMDYNPHLASVTEKNKMKNPLEKNQNLPITSAKLHETIKKKQSPTQQPKPFKISLNEIFGIEEVIKNKNVNKQEGPLKMSFNLEEMFENTKSQQTTIRIATTAQLIQTTSKPLTEKPAPSTEKPTPSTEKTVQTKLKTLSPKEDLNELLTNETEKENLSKILENRNMTVDELVQLRERGSSQKHLAEIFHNNTKEPQPVLEHVGRMNMQRSGKTIKNDYEVKPKNNSQDQINKTKHLEKSVEILHQSTSSEVFLKPLPDVSMSSEEITPARIPSTSFPTYKIETIKNNESPINTPFWKTVHPGTYNENRLLNKEIEEIEQKIAEAVNEDPINEMNNFDDDNFTLPIGLKSAIYASFAIMGISLLVFLTIMFIFKWSQRHKQRLTYNENFTCSKIKSPILTGNHTPRTFKTFVSETLGRKKHIYKTHVQSMSDSWDQKF